MLQAVFQPTKQLKSAEDKTSEGQTAVSQVTPLLGITPSKNNQLQHRNTPDDRKSATEIERKSREKEAKRLVLEKAKRIQIQKDSKDKEAKRLKKPK